MPGGMLVGQNSTASVTIKDDDNPGKTVNPQGRLVNEAGLYFDQAAIRDNNYGGCPVQNVYKEFCIVHVFQHHVTLCRCHLQRQHSIRRRKYRYHQIHRSKTPFHLLWDNMHPNRPGTDYSSCQELYEISLRQTCNIKSCCFCLGSYGVLTFSQLPIRFQQFEIKIEGVNEDGSKVMLNRRELRLGEYSQQSSCNGCGYYVKWVWQALSNLLKINEVLLLQPLTVYLALQIALLSAVTMCFLVTPLYSCNTSILFQTLTSAHCTL